MTSYLTWHTYNNIALTWPTYDKLPVKVLRPTRHIGYFGDFLSEPISWHGTEETKSNKKDKQHKTQQSKLTHIYKFTHKMSNLN